MSYKIVTEFENKIAEYFGSPYAVAVDCCTHGVELCLRRANVRSITVPKRTYPSIPFLATKLNIELVWKDEDWVDYYYVGDTNVIDAAVLWKENSYVPGTFMCISFQYRKHLSLGRGGMILTDSKEARDELKRMSCDGREPDSPWREQNISSMGYHYYMTPETAEKGLQKLPSAISTKPKQWTVLDWPDLTEMDIFNKVEGIDPYLQTR